MATCLEKCGLVAQEYWRKANRRKKMEGDMLATKLQRCLRTGDLILIGLSHMLGSGVYVLTGSITRNVSGASTIIAYVLAGIVSILNGVCYAGFSVNVPKAGSAYNYIYIVSGELWGFLAGWNLILDYLISVAAVARALSAYIDSLSGNVISNATLSVVGHVDAPLLGEIDFLAGGLCILTFLFISVGMRAATNISNAATVLNIIVLLTIAIAGFVLGSLENMDEDHGGFFPYGAKGMFAATGMLIYAYVGFDAVAVAAEETANPNRSLPLGMIMCVISACFLYCLVSLALSLLSPYNDIDIQVPFPTAFANYSLPWISGLIAAGSILGMMASLLGQTYCLSRSIYAMACDGLIFHQLQYVHPWTQTPLISIAFTALFSTILSVVSNFEDLVDMLSIGTLFAMSAMVLSLIKLHYIPITHCPFELLDSEQHCSTKYADLDEKKAILPKAQDMHQKERIGTLLHLRGLLGGRSDDDVNSLVIGVLFVSLVVLSATIMRTYNYIVAAQWWAIMFLSLSIIGTIIAFGLLLMFEPNRSFAKYSVPFIPWLPVFTLFANLCLMMHLNHGTWIRLIAWILIGVVIYIVYGIQHSTAHQQEVLEIELEDTSITFECNKAARGGTTEKHD